MAFLQTDGISFEDIQAAVENLNTEVSQVWVFIGALTGDKADWATRVAQAFLNKFLSCTFQFYVCGCGWPHQNIIPEKLHREGQSRKELWGKESCEMCVDRDHESYKFG